jgi:hypothetical protein
MGDEAVDSTTSVSNYTSSMSTPPSGGPTCFIVVAPSCCCGLDCVLCYRVRDLSVGFDLGFPPRLRAGPCERWAQSRCFGRVINERTNFDHRKVNREGGRARGRKEEREGELHLQGTLKHRCTRMAFKAAGRTDPTRHRRHRRNRHRHRHRLRRRRRRRAAGGRRPRPPAVPPTPPAPSPRSLVAPDPGPGPPDPVRIPARPTRRAAPPPRRRRRWRTRSRRSRRARRPGRLLGRRLSLVLRT